DRSGVFWERRSGRRRASDDLGDAPDLRGLRARGAYEGAGPARHDLRPRYEDAGDARAVGPGPERRPARAARGIRRGRARLGDGGARVPKLQDPRALRARRC
ncbi:MAG: hypothetical protein AVDCRST_MAG93-1090, partial [uncultured Chloroflexia bacterium]